MANNVVLYLSYDGLTDPLGQSQILPYLAGLSAEGFLITIVSFEKPGPYLLSRDMIQKFCDDHKIAWEPLMYHKSPPVLSTLYDLYRLRQRAKELYVRKGFDIVHCRSYITSLVGVWLKKKFAVNYVFDMRGFWADERVEGGLWRQSNPVYRMVYNFFKRKERQFIQQADTVIVLTYAAKNEITTWNITKTIEVIPCCVDLDLFNRGSIKEAKQVQLRKELQISDNDYVLLYLGSIGTWYLWDSMCDYFESVKRQHGNAKFLILTPDVSIVPNRHDYITRMVKRTEVPEYVSLATASVCFIKPSFSKKGSSATKMAEVLAMGVPVISNAGWGDVEFLDGKLANLYVLHDTNQTIAPKSNTLLMDNTFFQDFFSLSGGIAKYKMVYESFRIK